MGGEGGGRVGTCELQAHEEGGEANKGGHMEGGAGAPGARYVGEHVVVRALGGHGPLFVVAEFSQFRSYSGLRRSTVLLKIRLRTCAVNLRC